MPNSNSCEDTERQETVDSITGTMELSNMSGESGAIAPFKKWIKRQLGDPNIRVELTDDQLYDCIQTAYHKYYSTVETQEKYWQFQTIPRVNIYPLPKDFECMGTDFNFIPNTIIGFIQTFTSYQLMVNFTGNLDVTSFESLMQGLQLKLNRIGATPTYEVVYTPDPHLKIYPSPNQVMPVVFSYIAVQRLEDWQPQSDRVGWGWIRRRALAEAKEILGRTRSRFGDNVVSGAQTVVQDGAVLLAEAKEEKTTLDTELQGLIPLGFSVF